MLSRWELSFVVIILSDCVFQSSFIVNTYWKVNIKSATGEHNCDF